jgi:hypothetical protein
MGAELTLRYSAAEELAEDFEANLRKGRAFVKGASGLPQRAVCTLHIEHPEGGGTLDVPAEAVWISEHPETGGIGLEIVNFDAQMRDSLQAFVATANEPLRARSGTRRRLDQPGEPAPSGEPTLHGEREPDAELEPRAEAPREEVISQTAPTKRNLHERVRELSLEERDALAREGSLPERVALERRYGSSVWEGLLQNPQLTAREVCQMAKSGNLPTHLINQIVSNASWLADNSIRNALLQNPRVGGTHLERVLRSASQTDLRNIAEQTSVRMQVRTAAKRLIRR